MNNKLIKMLPVFIFGMVVFTGCATHTVTENQNIVEITLSDSGITANSNGVMISDSTVTIINEGTYIFSGTLSDGNIIVDAGKEKTIDIVLNGVSISSKTFAPIYVAQADKVCITLAENTINTLANGGVFTPIDDNNVDAVIFSKDDITLNGKGTLKISSPAGEGITGKDEITITSGNYEITSSKTAIRANDGIAITDGTFTITSDKDGIHSDTTLVIDGGTYDITAAEGLEATEITINDGKISINASDDGINAAEKSSNYSPKIEINGGDITIDMGPGDTDGVDSNGDIIINGGTINVTGNSTFDYDGEGVINGGTVIANGEEITTLPNQIMGGHGEGKWEKDGMDGQNGNMREPGNRMPNESGDIKGPGRMGNPNFEPQGPRDRMPNENEGMKDLKDGE